MNVLSLFDGMSCGRIALERAGVKVDSYYASEIDKHAIRVSKSNYPDIVHIGDVTKVDGQYLLRTIDLLIGGSPCQGFSFAGRLLNFDDPRSKLFFEYVRILKEIRYDNPNVKFLLENVKMQKAHQDVISEYLGCEPVFICSSNFSAQKRKRLYWTNIPGVTTLKATLEGAVLSDIVDNFAHEDSLYLNDAQIERAKLKHSATTFASGIRNGNVKFPTPLNEKSKCLNTVRIKGDRTMTHVQNGAGIRLLSVSEYEKLQTVPVDYTLGVSENAAYKMLGNGWTVDVIAHIFKGLHNEWLYS